MIEPVPAKAGEPAGFGLGFAISKLDGERMIGHNGAVYGFATDVQALPDSRLGVVVITPPIAPTASPATLPRPRCG